MSAVRGVPKQLQWWHQRSLITKKNIIIMKTSEISQEFPKRDTETQSENMLSKSAQDRVATKFQFVTKKKKKNLQGLIKWRVIKEVCLSKIPVCMMQNNKEARLRHIEMACHSSGFSRIICLWFALQGSSIVQGEDAQKTGIPAPLPGLHFSGPPVAQGPTAASLVSATACPPESSRGNPPWSPGVNSHGAWGEHSGEEEPYSLRFWIPFTKAR